MADSYSAEKLSPSLSDDTPNPDKPAQNPVSNVSDLANPDLVNNAPNLVSADQDPVNNAPDPASADQEPVPSSRKEEEADDAVDDKNDDAVDLGFEDDVTDLRPEHLDQLDNAILPTMPQQVRVFIVDLESVIHRAENNVREGRFGLTEAKNFVLSLREVVSRHEELGAPGDKMEAYLISRAMILPGTLIDGVQQKQVETHDPRQTLVFMFCALSVFSRSIWFDEDSMGLIYKFSFPLVNLFYEQLLNVVRFCNIKTDCEGSYNAPNFHGHQRMLLDLASWLERDRPVTVFLMMSQGFAHVEVMLQILKNFLRNIHVPSDAKENTDRLQRLLSASDILKTSCLIRTGFLKVAQEHNKFLQKVNAGSLPPALSVKLAYVQGSLLLHCGQLDRALDRAEHARSQCKDETERLEIEDLIARVQTAISNSNAPQENANLVDTEWLEGTNVSQTELGIRRQEGARRRHHTKPRRSRPRRPSPDSRSQTPSPAPPIQGRQRVRHDSGYPPSRQIRVSVSPDSSSSYSSHRSLSNSRGVVHVARDRLPNSAMTPSSESIPTYADFDDDDDESDEDDEHDYRRLALSYGDLYDTDEESADGEEPVPTFTGVLQGARGDQATPAEEPDWYDRSVQVAETGEDEEDLGEKIELSVNQQEFFSKGGRDKMFYPDILTNENKLEALLQQDPDHFKRCQLKIESSHRSIAKILTKHAKFTDILIMGRSKCGRTYMDDEVVVEVLAEPGQNKGLQTAGRTATDEDREAQEHMAFGQVVGYFPSRRGNYAHVHHPVLFCTVDELEGYLMKPLCKTVPKIHVMNDTVKRKYPALVKHRIEIKRISPAGDVEHKGFFNMEPAKREQYVFRVVILSWRQQNIYPLGAVLEAHVGGRDYASGLEVLKLQQRVPRLYPHDVVTDTDSILQNAAVLKSGRLDLTSRQVFTIDPPGSQDLDDALSVWREGPRYVVGVHIADVAMTVPEGSRVDLEARKRAVTFYPLNRKPHPMLPEPLSHNKCSLLEGQERYALSVFYKFNVNGKQVDEPDVKKTVIKSAKQLTYQDAQRAIEDDRTAGLSDSLREDIKLLHNIAQQLRESRFHRSQLYVPFEDPRLKDLDDLENSLEAHALVEELMVLTNEYIARRLASPGSKFRDVMILRCHAAPTWEELAEWREKEGSAANLVMQLQGRKVSPDTQLSVEAHRPDVLYQRQDVVVQEELWERLRRHLEDGELEEARQLAFMDDVHPLQCLANKHWMDLMDTAQYKCSYGLNTPEHYHFGLDLPYYTHFTSPIRRYADLHVHRLLHADLDGRAPGCDDDVTRLCQNINSATARQKAFGKGCLALKMADSLQSQPLMFRTFVEQVDSEQLTLMVPSLRAVSDRKQELPFSILGVSKQPEVTTDTAQRKNYVTVQWNKKIYNEHGTCPGDFKVKREALERCSRRSCAPLVIDVNPHLHSVTLRQTDWADILKALATYRGLDFVPLPVETNRPEVNHMSSEKGDGTVSLRPCHFRTVYSPGQVLQVQMSAEPRRGVLQPRVDLLHTARNASECTLHVRDPVLSLTRHATRATREQQFTSYKDYVRAWMPLLEMEAAFGAGATDDVVSVENVPVLMKAVDDPVSSKDRMTFTGSFSLSAKFCFDRCIEFGGKSPDSIRESKSGGSSNNTTTSHAFPLDYLCIRYRTECPATVVSRVRQYPVPEAVDRHYTWIGHAGIVAAKHKGRKDEDGGRLHVTFVLSHSSPPPPARLMEGDGDKVTLEILPKSAVDRRAQQMLLGLENEECDVARAIAYGAKMPKLDKDHKRLGRKDENHEEQGAKLPWNNPPQLEAIKTALTNTVSLIQGPPGTGKTYTGIKLVYLFCKINRQLAAEGKGKKTVLFCGPSNKSVDLVAKLLKKRLGPLCPKIVRVYGSAIESQDYPVPRGNLRSARGMRDLKSDPKLADVTLHHIIRESGKPYAEKLAQFESFFEKCRQNPELYNMDSKSVKSYHMLVHKASVEELRNYEVVLTTCGVAGNRRLIEGTEGNIFQVLIDECAMSPEPHSLVPIIATKARQVVLIGDHCQLRPIITCKAAADLGLDQSLFERLYKLPSSRRVFLSTQYRMHPQICEFPSEEFYGGKLKTGFNKNTWQGDILPFWPTLPRSTQVVPHILVDVRGEEDTLTVNTDEGNERSKSNQVEADMVVKIFKFLKGEHGVETGQIKVLTQYNAQRHLIDDKLKKLCEDRSQTLLGRYDKSWINVSTVVSSQGGEWDYVILSTVRSLPSYKIEPNPTHGWCIHNLGFITDRNQVNVALTRARKGLIIVGNKELLRCDEVWRHLVGRYERLHCVLEADNFPPPPPSRGNQRRRHPVPSLEWQEA